MEVLIVKYIAKHGLVRTFDGIEKADEPYERAMSQFKNCPRMPKKKLLMHSKLYLPHTR